MYNIYVCVYIYYIVCLISFRNTSWMAGFVYVNVLTSLFHAHKIVPLFQWDSILVILKGCSGDYPPIPTIKQWTWPHQSDTCAWLILDINTPTKMNSRKICKNQSAYMIPYVIRIYHDLPMFGSWEFNSLNTLMFVDSLITCSRFLLPFAYWGWP